MKRFSWFAILGASFLTVLGSRWLLDRPYATRGLALGAPPAPANCSGACEQPNRSLTVSAAESAGAAASPGPALSVEPVIIAAPRTRALQNTRQYLLVGLDRRPGAKGGGLADTILVAVSPESGDALGLVSIPRDLLVEIPGHGPDRINATLGVAARKRLDPLAVLSRVVEDTLGLPIEHALAIDLGVFERAVDRVGGVTVDVPCAIHDDFVDTRTATGRRLLRVESGQQQLDGVTAAMYVRSRHGRSDFDRARRQQAVLVAVREQVLTPGGVLNVPDLIDEFESSIATDMRRIELLRLAQRFAAVSASRLHGLVLGHAHVIAARTSDGHAVLLPKPDVIHSALEKLFTAPPPGTRPSTAACPAADVALRVRASSERPSIAPTPNAM